MDSLHTDHISLYKDMYDPLNDTMKYLYFSFIL